MPEDRWLKPEAAAAYVGVRPDYLRRLVRSGKLPAPSFHLGVRSPRYDRAAIDALFTGSTASASIDQIEQDAVNAILERAHRQKTAGRRFG